MVFLLKGIVYNKNAPPSPTMLGIGDWGLGAGFFVFFVAV